jgi:glycerol-3-phosphate dehydrogenase
MKPVNLLVIGGGINGVAIARDAVRRGLSVTLLERDDIGAGTSADSTKLIHGGLRYLEYGELHLVYESLHERERLLNLAPHLVLPMRFRIPIYKQREYSRPIIGTGLLMYDVLTGLGTQLPRHKWVSKESFLRDAPHISTDGLRGGFEYSDAQVAFPERLCLENALDARDCGAEILTRHEVTGFLREDSCVVGVTATDRDTGEEKEFHAELTINAAGAWVDVVLNHLDPAIAHRMGGTRGMHLLFPRREGGPSKALYTPAQTDGRPFFVVPWREYYWVGTTDVEHRGDPDTAVPTVSECDYLLKELEYLLPGAKYTADDILYAQSGVRPLPAHNFDKPGAVTRRHIIWDHQKKDRIDGLLSIIGGKLTTYRSLAEQVVKIVYRRLERPVPSCPTRDLPLPGGGPVERPDGCDEELFAHLSSIYGSKTGDVMALAAENPELAERLDPELPDIGAQVAYAVRNEIAYHLDDVLLRRTGIGTGHTEGRGAAARAARIMADELGWDGDRRDQEIANYEKAVKQIHAVRDE